VTFCLPTPPPDLVVEVAITHTDIDKRSLYAAMGVPEFWRYDGKTCAKEMFYRFLSAAFEDEMGAGRSLRQHIRNLG